MNCLMNYMLLLLMHEMQLEQSFTLSTFKVNHCMGSLLFALWFSIHVTMIDIYKFGEI